MESYTRTASASSATLTFLEAWTTRLHALGYDAGVYSSSASGIADLAARLGGLYRQPDDLWFANWNGHANALDSYVPASAWADHQRIHQYRGGHDETYGGVTINVDNNYVEGATAGSGEASSDDPRGSFDAVSSPAPGQVTVTGWAFDPNAPHKQVSIRAYVGGKAGEGEATRYELGPIASQERSDLRRELPARRRRPRLRSQLPGRRQRPADGLRLRPRHRRRLRQAAGLPGRRRAGADLAAAGEDGRQRRRLRVRCEWPVGTDCPGQIVVRARVPRRVVVRRRGRRRAVTRLVTRAIARRGFHLNGGGAHTFRVGLGRAGHRLATASTPPRAQLLVAIPGGRVGRKLSLR